jgi:hypothetical protein
LNEDFETASKEIPFLRSLALAFVSFLFFSFFPSLSFPCYRAPLSLLSFPAPISSTPFFSFKATRRVRLIKKAEE